MSKRATVSPPWLDHMLIRWGTRSLHESGSGWYSINPMLKDGIATGRAPAEPFEMGTEDCRALDAAIDNLNPLQRAAVTRAYKPWSAASIDAKCPAAASTWCERLKSAARAIEHEMRVKAVA